MMEPFEQILISDVPGSIAAPIGGAVAAGAVAVFRWITTHLEQDRVDQREMLTAIHNMTAAMRTLTRAVQERADEDSFDESVG